MTNDERIAIFGLDFLDGTGAGPDGQNVKQPTGGAYLVHYFWTDNGGRERHEAGQYGDRQLSEIEEGLGQVEAAKIRTLRPGQSATWEGRYHGSTKQILVNRIW